MNPFHCTGRLISTDPVEQKFCDENNEHFKLFNKEIRTFIETILQNKTQDSTTPFRLSKDTDGSLTLALLEEITTSSLKQLPLYSIHFTPETEHLKSNVKASVVSIFYKVLATLPKTSA